MHSHRIATISLVEYLTFTSTCFREAFDMSMFTPLLGRLLCWLGFHDFRVVDRAFEFGAGGAIEKVECKRCGVTMTRQT